MNTKIKFSRTLYKSGDSLVMTIPPELQQLLGLTEGTKIDLQPEQGKYGSYISIWKQTQ